MYCKDLGFNDPKEFAIKFLSKPTQETCRDVPRIFRAFTVRKGEIAVRTPTGSERRTMTPFGQSPVVSRANQLGKVNVYLLTLLAFVLGFGFLNWGTPIS